MFNPTSQRRATGALLIVAALAACVDDTDQPFAPAFAVTENQSGPNALEVYTQNLFMGGETGPLFTVDFNNIPEVAAAVGVFWADVQSTNIPQRAAEIVDEIEAREPHVVGLQEAYQFALLDGSFQPIGGLDLLAAVEAHIAARGLPYTTELVQNTTVATLPLALGPTGVSTWLHAIDRIATLRRTDIELLDVDQGEYGATFMVGPVVLKRGWARMTVRHAGTTYHHVNTHLEIQPLAPVQAGQTFELINSVLAGLPDGVTVLSGDLNSNAAAQPGDPTWTPTYGDLIAAGFVDVWEAAPPADRDIGLTCCHDKSLTGNLPFDQRIDFVMVRGSKASEDAHGLFEAELVGEEQGDLTSGGLWPSDHAGLIGRVMEPGRVR